MNGLPGHISQRSRENVPIIPIQRSLNKYAAPPYTGSWDKVTEADLRDDIRRSILLPTRMMMVMGSLLADNTCVENHTISNGPFTPPTVLIEPVFLISYPLWKKPSRAGVKELGC
ncbi:MAG: hypothetical protein Q9215_007704 [Flavoplaca cf. flavocitrina]